MCVLQIIAHSIITQPNFILYIFTLFYSIFRHSHNAAGTCSDLGSTSLPLLVLLALMVITVDKDNRRLRAEDGLDDKRLSVMQK